MREPAIGPGMNFALFAAISKEIEGMLAPLRERIERLEKQVACEHQLVESTGIGNAYRCGTCGLFLHYPTRRIEL